MASNSVVTQDKLQEFYNTKVYPYLNGSAHNGLVPVGARLDGWFATPPEHYLLCDGTEYLKTAYPQLAEHLAALDTAQSTTYYTGSDSSHFKVPDLRGEFIRGTGTNGHTNQGSGSAKVGGHQNATLINATYTSYEHNLIQNYVNINSGYPRDEGNADKELKIGEGKKLEYSGTKATYPDIDVDVFAVRTTNTSLPQYICYENHFIDAKHNYSTDEHIVGTWIDGKPIYEKTYSNLTLNISYSSFTNTNIPASYMEQIISCKGYDNNGSYIDGLITNTYGDGSRYSFLNMQTQRNAANVNINILCIQYTKTTDTAQS